MLLRDILAPVLALLLIVPEGLLSQQPGPPSAPRVPASGLHILVLQGQNATNSLPRREAASPAVQVFDYLNEPVEGAEVTFEVPASGPSGVFENQKNSLTTRTDARGQAMAGFTPNTLPGSFAIRVVAKAGDQVAETLIRQTNSDKVEAVQFRPPPKRPWYKSWKLWTVVLAGAGAGAYLGYRAATSSSSPTISLTPGPIVIGGH